METDHRSSLEQALTKTETDADAACKAATAALRSLKKFRAAAQVGNLRELQKAIEVAGQVLTDLSQQFAKAAAGWSFDEDAHLSNGAYSTAVKTRGKERRETSAIVPLVEIYNLLTLLPGQAKEYARQEFARDLYLLDQSDVTAVRNGAVVSFHAARGNEPAG